MRLDNFLSKILNISRTQASDLIRQKEIFVNNSLSLHKDQQVSNTDEVRYHDKILEYEEYVYYLLNKPSGYVCDTSRSLYPSVFTLIKDYRQDLACAGRLDVDSVGLVLITNDGALVHQVIANNFITKTYYVELAKSLTDEQVQQLEAGCEIYLDKEKTIYLTKPAKVQRLTNESIYLTISEGKFHQVKKMVKYVDNEVTLLKRVAIGNIKLPEIPLGTYLKITKPTI